VDDLAEKWKQVASCDLKNGWRALRIADVPETHNIYIALDGLGLKHLIILAQGADPAKLWKTRGLEIASGEFGIGDFPLAAGIRLSCLDKDFDETFVSLAGAAIRAARVSSHPISAALETAKEFRWFWSIHPQPMTGEQELGLFGELWCLNRYFSMSIDAAIDGWNGPKGARHDFQFTKGSLEVKTTSKAGIAPVVVIANLEQLSDPVTGGLFLFVIQASEDALASNSLVAEIQSLLTKVGPTGKVALLERLAKTGYNPVLNEQLKRRFRILTERLYKVGPDFPRITASTFLPNGLPVGTGNISYTLDTAVLNDWLIASDHQGIMVAMATL
jgi:hypothetical protein